MAYMSKYRKALYNLSMYDYEYTNKEKDLLILDELIDYYVDLSPKYKKGDKVCYGMMEEPYEIESIVLGYIIKDTAGFVGFEDNLSLYKEPQVQEVTMYDLEKKYGCKVKVVK